MPARPSVEETLIRPGRSLVDGAPPLPWTGERFIPTEGGPEIYYEHSHRYLLARSALAGRSVVDLASGEGYGSAWLAQVARNVTGVDIDEAAVRHARARYAASPNLRFTQGDIENLPLADGCADAVVCFEAIEHVPNPRRVVEETVRVLRPGGLFFVSTPNKALYTDAREYTNEFHVHEFYLTEFERLLKEFFPEHVLLGQRVVAGSLAWPLADRAGSAVAEDRGPTGVFLAPGFDDGAGGGETPMVEPLYVIACCRLAGDSTGALPMPIASVLVDPEEGLLNTFRECAASGAGDLQALQDRLARAEVELSHARQEARALRGSLSESDSLTALLREQEVAVRLSEDLEAATELSARLLVEVDALQRVIIQQQLATPVSAATRSPEPEAVPAPRNLLRLARLVLTKARRAAGSARS